MTNEECKAEDAEPKSEALIEEYPEHMKLRAISDESQAIYNFLEWCEEQGGTGRSIRDLLAAHFEIDQDKIEAEKCAMLESIRARG